MIKHIKISEERGDTSAKYRVDFDRKYTVSTFVDMLLEERIDAWGNVCVAVDPEKPHKLDNPSLWYNRGHIERRETYENVMAEYGNRVIRKAEGDGAWSRMDYTLWLEEEKKEDPEEMPEEEENEENTGIPEEIKKDERRTYYENIRARKHRKK